MKRREFVQKTVAGSALVAGGIALSGFAPKVKRLTVLHTNDVHSYIDPFPADHPKNPNMGGVARRAAMIEKIRKEADNVLLLDAGDIFQGTPYFNYYGGALELKLMSMMKYDLATMGNHDFDNGIDGFYEQLHNANFSFVSANYDFSKTVLDGIVKPYKIINRGGIKIGIFGLGVELAGLVDKKHYKETVYRDPVGITQDVVRELKDEKKCDMIICLSHLGYRYKDEPEKISDLKLAALTTDIDLIIGGHTHTFLDKPTMIINAAGKSTLVNQVGCYGINLGRIDFELQADGKVRSNGNAVVI
ncbi:MAG TPA: metallophosphatase [Flavobacterium sp.]|jgi:5'-nucleotidase